jgi:hypothetical protein
MMKSQIVRDAFGGNLGNLQPLEKYLRAFSQIVPRWLAA